MQFGRVFVATATGCAAADKALSQAAFVYEPHFGQLASEAAIVFLQAVELFI